MGRQAESRVKCAFQQRMRHGTQFTMNADPISRSFQIRAHQNQTCGGRLPCTVTERATFDVVIHTTTDPLHLYKRIVLHLLSM